MERLLKRIKNKQDCTAVIKSTGTVTPATTTTTTTIDLETTQDLQQIKRGTTNNTTTANNTTTTTNNVISPIIEFNPRLITKKFCGRKNKQDNELYRSNSFKFERFDRTDSALDLAQMTKQGSSRI
ncbi:hypothetical protein O3M35_008247 [Rhynocoris fuscipes]|uniref:Uncharacterized protein n=1 Tax=Rhynocoris fuscipes TaxID=488301 RepID=A0AAW1D5J7_9HEMI